MPDFIEHEAKYINQLFEAGIDLLHLRKPNSNIEDCERLLQEIPQKWHSQIVVHDHFELCEKYQLHGIHLNRRNHQIPEGVKGSISRSCHSLEEIKEIFSKHKEHCTQKKNSLQKESPIYQYVFLSPIFDSISKQGYTHSFSNKDLEDAAANGLINSKVIALGGITALYIPQLRAWNFGGAAFLGDVWNRRKQSDWTNYLEKIRQRLTPASPHNSLHCSNVW